MRERKLNRLPGFDYSSGGAYFVTICVHGRKCVFGAIADGAMQRNQPGEIASQCWNDLPHHYLNCRLDTFVVMPNHVHGIIWIVDSAVGNGLKPFPADAKRHGLPEIIRGFKTFSSRRINAGGADASFRWQKSYYDRIIRNDHELNRIREYIAHNPANWHEDAEYVG